MADVIRTATYHPHTSFPLGEAFVPHAFTRATDLYPLRGNSESAQVRPSAMASVLQTGIVESRKYFAMLDAGWNADMERRTRREWPLSEGGQSGRISCRLDLL